MASNRTIELLIVISAKIIMVQLTTEQRIYCAWKQSEYFRILSVAFFFIHPVVEHTHASTRSNEYVIIYFAAVINTFIIFLKYLKAWDLIVCIQATSIVKTSYEVIVDEGELNIYNDNPAVMLDEDIPFVDPALFTNFDEWMIGKAAMNTNGANWPFRVGCCELETYPCVSQLWWCRKHHRSSLSTRSRHFATKKISLVDYQATNREAYRSCRLTPLDKSPGVHLMGIGEVLRLIIGIKPRIMKSAGNFYNVLVNKLIVSQPCMPCRTSLLRKRRMPCFLLMPTPYATSIARWCSMTFSTYPAIATYAYNSYVTPCRLFVQGGNEIPWQDKWTRSLLHLYAIAIAITPLLELIKIRELNKFRETRCVCWWP